MNPDIPVQTGVRERFYTVDVIWFGSFFGGPLALAYFLSRNYSRLGNARAARRTMWSGIGLMVVLTIALAFVPNSFTENLSSPSIPITTLAIAYLLYSQLQSKAIDERLKTGASKESFWKAFGIGILGLVCMYCLIFLIGLILTPFFDFS